MYRVILALITLTFSSVVYPLGRTVTYEEMKNDLFNAIIDISFCGEYSHRRDVGQVRLIQVYAYGGSMLFLDTLKWGGSGLVDHYGLSITQINNDHLELEIEKLGCVDLGANQIQIKGYVNGTGHDASLQYYFTIDYDAHTGAYQYVQTDKEK